MLLWHSAQINVTFALFSNQCYFGTLPKLMLHLHTAQINVTFALFSNQCYFCTLHKSMLLLHSAQINVIFCTLLKSILFLHSAQINVTFALCSNQCYGPQHPGIEYRIERQSGMEKTLVNVVTRGRSQSDGTRYQVNAKKSVILAKS